MRATHIPKKQVIKICTVKHVQRCLQGVLKKELVIADSSIWIKVVLWHLWRRWNGHTSCTWRYLATIDTSMHLKRKSFSWKKLKILQPDVPSLISSCKIVEVFQVTKQICCLSCSKKVINLENAVLVYSTFSKLTQMKNTCSAQWYIRILVKDCFEKSFTVTLFHPDVKLLHAVMKLNEDLTSCAEGNIAFTFLTSGQVVELHKSFVYRLIWPFTTWFVLEKTA